MRTILVLGILSVVILVVIGKGLFLSMWDRKSTYDYLD